MTPKLCLMPKGCLFLCSFIEFNLQGLIVIFESITYVFNHIQAHIIEVFISDPKFTEFFKNIHTYTIIIYL